MLAFAYNKDKNSVKQSMRWLVDLVIGGSDNTEGELIEKQIQAQKDKLRLEKEGLLAKNELRH